MYTDNSQVTAQTMLDVRNWVKRGRYVRLELCACAMRHCIDGKFFLRQPLEKLYLLAQPIAEEMGDRLVGFQSNREEFSRPFVNLLNAGAKPEEVSELLDQFEIFFVESLENGFNAPVGPAKQILVSRFQQYLQEARTILFGLSAKAPVVSSPTQSRLSSSNFSFTFLEVSN